MGRYLGDLGKAKRQGDWFGWFGEKIRVGEKFSDLRLLDFLEDAGGIPDTDQAAQMKALRDFFHSIVHEDDWSAFWDACLDNGQGVVDLMTLVHTLTSESTGHPSKRRSDSSPGRRDHKGKSKGDSSSRVIRRLEKKGRPDLALIVDMAQSAQRSTG